MGCIDVWEGFIYRLEMRTDQVQGLPLIDCFTKRRRCSSCSNRTEGNRGCLTGYNRKIVVFIEMCTRDTMYVDDQKSPPAKCLPCGWHLVSVLVPLHVYAFAPKDRQNMNVRG